MRTAISLVLAMVAGFALNAGAEAAPLGGEHPPMIEVTAEGASGFTAEIEFGAAALEPGWDASGNRYLTVSLPGIAPEGEPVDGLTLPALTRLVAVPAGYRVEARATVLEETSDDLESLISRDALGGRALRSLTETEPLIEAGAAGWMRYLRVAPVVIRPVRYIAATHQLASVRRMELQFDFIPDGSPTDYHPDLERLGSQAFDELFRALLLNPGSLPVNILPGGQPVRRGSYVIITDSALVARHATTGFADWKRRKGFDVRVEPIYRLGVTNANDIRAFLQNAYDHWERPPEFILLLGDVNAAGIELPAFWIANPKGGGEDDPTDQPYTYLAGDDFFPDAFIGRISTDSPTTSEALNALERVIRYEREILEQNDLDIAAFHRATLFAGNFGEEGRPVVSPVENAKWLGERLRERRYETEEFYFSAEDTILIQSDDITRSINRKVNIVAYRGWADANGTHYPPFYTEDLDRLDNGPLLPLFLFFVCNTGNYGSRVQPCFGEYSITRGNFNDPKGAIAFYGASDLKTSSRYNNPMLAGLFTAMLFENVRTLGPLTVRGKFELWREFPHERGRGDDNYVEFYFSIYNILGDPELNFYFDAPYRMEVTRPETLKVGDTFARFEVRDTGGSPVRGAMVVLRKEGETDLTLLTDDEGLALAPVNLESAGTLQMTVIAHQAAPTLADIPVVQSENMVGFDTVLVANGLGDDRLVVGSPVSLTVTLRNSGGAAANGVSATLASPLDGITISDGSVGFGNIAAGSSAQGDAAFTVELNPLYWIGTQVPFTLKISDGGGHNYIALFRLPVSNGGVALENYRFGEEMAAPGVTTSLVLTVKNFGNLDLQGLNAKLYTWDESVVIEDSVAAFGDLAVGQSVECTEDPFRIRVREGTCIGRQVTLRPVFYDGQGRMVAYFPFNITVGEVSADDPLGPDGYGYFAYESGDDHELYPEAPTFDWIELDPDYDGAGAELHEVSDDTIFVMDLPFSFKYYGKEHQRITVCDNGWLSLGVTWMADFRNWGLPSPLGPKNLIAPFWDDLTKDDPAHPGNANFRLPVRILTRYDSDQGRFIVEWSRAINRQGFENQVYTEETFEVVLYDPAVHATATGDGEILFQYLRVGNIDEKENYATVGIEDEYHRRGLEVTFSGIYPPAIDTLRNETAIKFTTTQPDTFLGANEEAPSQPMEFNLAEPYPNPFNSQAVSSYKLQVSSWVKLGLYDLNGRLVQMLAEGWLEAGSHQAVIDGTLLPSGIYLIKLESGGRVANRKAVLLR